MNLISEEKMLEILDKSYDLAIDGVASKLSARELAEEYMSKSNSKEYAAKKLIGWQVSKCSTSGFLSGLGGVITMPVTLPANIVNVIYVQIRMVAAVAAIGGYDLKDDSVKSLVYMCLCGNGAKDIAKGVGINVGTKLTYSIIKKIPGATLTKINQKVGFRLVTKFGTKGAINLGKMVPIAGGVIGAGFDGVSTKVIGDIALRIFI